MKATLDKILNWPPIAHIVAAFTRFNVRLGFQFAAAISYFSVLSMVPILMFTFAMIGMTLTVLQPELLGVVRSTIDSVLSGADEDLADSVGRVVENALNNWRGVSIVALLTAAYAGSRWAGNLKRAVRMMWREVPVDEERRVNPVLNIASNIVIFLGLLLCFVVGVAVAQAGSSASNLVVAWLGLEHVPGIGTLLRLASVFMTFVASWILMAFLFLVMPDEKARLRPWLIGVSLGALLITVLQQLAGTLIGIFSNNEAASLFGPIIVVMLLLNTVMSVVLMMAAWIGTDASMRSGIEEQRNRAARMAATRSAEALVLARRHVPDEGPAMVRQEVAERGVRAGLGVGYGVGAATGMGLGAIVAAIVAFGARILGRR